MSEEHLPTRKKGILPVIIFMLIVLMVVLPVSAVAPTITLLGRDPASVALGSVAYFDAGAIATDPEQGDLTASIIVTNPVNVAVAGTYTVTYSVTDAELNTVTATRVVNVVNRLAPATIPKYQTPLVIPPEMPKTSSDPAMDYYEIAVREFSQQILPAGLPPTTVWSYGSATTPGTFNYPAFTIEATANKMTKVKWMNQLVDQNGNYLPHLLPIDQTLHWANPVAGIAGRDHVGTDPNPYMGPVPAVIHVHGAHTSQESDGFPEAWYLPVANNIPAGYATTGTYYDLFKVSSPVGAEWTPGTSVFEYPNDQRATTLWYHDHSLGMTRTNVYTGPAGFYLLRGGADDISLGFNRPSLTLNQGVNPADVITEIPIAIQDRAFNEDGSLFYPDSRAFFDGFGGPYAPASDIAPIWNPEFFGDSIVVNGKTWPFQDVQQRQYRLRILNGDQARFLILKMDNNMPFTVIGTEGGFLPQPVQQTQLLIGPAERFDVIVDFSGVAAGTNIIMQNIGPDSPFGGGVPCPIGQDPVTNPGCGDFAPADAATTGQVMQFRVVPATVADPSTPVASLTLPVMPTLGAADLVRQVSLNEVSSSSPLTPGVGPKAALLGTVMPPMTPGGMPMGMPMMWMDAVTEVVNQSDTEEWEIYDFTMDAHPIHIHQVQFQVVNREIFDPMVGTPGTIIPPETWESGYKDTVIVYPGQLTRVKAKFNLAGLYVWHCHILEHEDNEMMRPYEVIPNVNSGLSVCKQNSTGTMLSGWDFALNTGQINTTDSSGCALFTGLQPIEYTVTETLQPNWANITPLSQNIILPNRAQGNLLFINELFTSSLSVCKQNSTGTMLNGWDFTLNTGQTNTTDTSGCALFTGLEPVEHTVTETPKPGWVNVTPLEQSIVLTPKTRSSLTFVNDHMPDVSWLNVCKQDQTGAMLSGWDFTLMNGPTQTTDATGCTVFDGLQPIEYTVTETLKPGWTNITPLSQSITLPEAGPGTLTFVNEQTGPEPVPEFPSGFLPLAFIIGFLAVVMIIQKTREH